MDPVTIAALAEQAVTLALQIYQQVKAANEASANPVAMQSLSDLIAAADASFAQVQVAAKV